MSGDKTLIAYATRGGTTEDYAKAMGSVLVEEYKMQADLVDLRTNHNPDLAPYRNVIVGAGIRIFKMHREGEEFLEKTDFGDRRVIVFLSSLMPKEEAIKKYVDPIVQKNTRLKPIAVEVFGGRMRMLGRTTEDKTDIEKAREWTRKLAAQLQS